MKKTKKMLAAMLAVSTLAAALSGCSGGNKTEAWSLRKRHRQMAIMGRQRQGRLNPARRRQIPMVKSLHQKAMGSCGRRPLRRSVL